MDAHDHFHQVIEESDASIGVQNGEISVFEDNCATHLQH
jgi:hypothetical protein